MEVQVELRVGAGLELRGSGSSTLGIGLCLTHATCLTQRGSSTLTVSWLLSAPARFEFRHRGVTSEGLVLPRLLKGPQPNWWNRKTITVKEGGAVHQYWDRSGKLSFVGCKGRFYQL